MDILPVREGKVKSEATKPGLSHMAKKGISRSGKSSRFKSSPFKPNHAKLSQAN